MPDSLQKSAREVSVFQEFAERSGLPIVPNSIGKREPPEPDILCQVTDKGHVAFEIKEMCDEPIAKVVSDLRKTNDDEPKFLRLGYAVQDIAIKTRNKKYRTNYPVELLLYTDGRIVLPPDVIIPEIRLFFENDRHLFRRVWFMGQPGETCECVYQAPENP